MIYKIVGIIFVILGLFTLATMYQSVSCSIDLQFGAYQPDSCLGHPSFFQFVFSGDNSYKLIFEIVLDMFFFFYGGYLIMDDW